MKKITVIILLSFCINYTNNKLNKILAHKINLKHEIATGSPYIVTATMYHPISSQCDSDPNLTAGLYIIPKNATAQKWIAISRDMIARWGGEFHYGDLVQITGARHKDGIYKIVDTMNKRFTNRIDFLESIGTKPYKFTNVTLAKVLLTESKLIASL